MDSEQTPNAAPVDGIVIEADMFPGCYETDAERLSRELRNTPADGEWLESVGAEFHQALNQYALGTGTIRVLFWPCESPEWFVEVSGEMGELPHIRTQNDVISLCAALGIELAR